jgi:hypothetical protein
MDVAQSLRDKIASLRAVQAGWAFGVPEDGQDQWLDIVVDAIEETITSQWLEILAKAILEERKNRPLILNFPQTTFKPGDIEKIQQAIRQVNEETECDDAQAILEQTDKLRGSR